MVFHTWGDKDVDWRGIDDAAQYIGEYCRKWGRLGVLTKEKYGTVRAYVSGFGTISLHSLIYPGYAYNQMPKWLWNLDLDYIQPFLQRVFGTLVHKWHSKVYAQAYLGALKRWPHLRAEILEDADYLELIPGAIRIVETPKETRTEILGWNGEVLSTWIRDKDILRK